MPLPPAPTRRASRLAKEAFDAPLRTTKRAAAALAEVADDDAIAPSTPVQAAPAAAPVRARKTSAKATEAKSSPQVSSATAAKMPTSATRWRRASRIRMGTRSLGESAAEGAAGAE